MERVTAAEIADRIIIKTYGLGADLEDSANPAKLVLALANGQRFTITVKEITR